MHTNQTRIMKVNARSHPSSAGHFSNFSGFATLFCIQIKSSQSAMLREGLLSTSSTNQISLRTKDLHVKAELRDFLAQIVLPPGLFPSRYFSSENTKIVACFVKFLNNFQILDSKHSPGHVGDYMQTCSYPLVQRSMMANLACHVEAPGKKECQLTKCLHQIVLKV